MVSLSAEPGRIRPISYGMFGKVLMAYLDQGEVDEILREVPLKRYTPHTITDKKTFKKILAEVRKQGVAVEVNEFVEGIMGVAAPIRDYTSRVVAAVGIALPASKNEDAREMKRLYQLVKEAGSEISTKIGYLNEAGLK